MTEHEIGAVRDLAAAFYSSALESAKCGDWDRVNCEWHFLFGMKMTLESLDKGKALAGEVADMIEHLDELQAKAHAKR